jgi:multidrug resistance efflux pump
MSELPYDIVGHVDGRVIKLNVQEGSDVKQGDVIAIIDSIQYEEEYVSANSALKELEAEREVKKAELATLERNPLPKELWYADTNLNECKEKALKTSDRLERYRRLHKINAISQKDFEVTEIENIQAQAELSRATENQRKVQSGLGDKYIEKAHRDIDLVQARLDGRRAARDLAAKHIAECRIVAPASGRIVSMPCKYTMYVEKGKVAVKMATGIMLKGLAYVDEGVVRKVRQGQSVRISSGVFNRLEFGNFFGKVDRIHDVPEEQKDSTMLKYPVEIIIDAEGRTLKLGSSAEFAIVTGREPVIYSLLGISKEDFKTRQERAKLRKAQTTAK